MENVWWLVYTKINTDVIKTKNSPDFNLFYKKGGCHNIMQTWGDEDLLSVRQCMTDNCCHKSVVVWYCQILSKAQRKDTVTYKGEEKREVKMCEKREGGPE